MLHRGQIAYFKTVGEQTRPCIVVSNDDYNQMMSTVMVVPISLADKYQQERFVKNPMFMTIHSNEINGTALLQHLRTIDSARLAGEVVAELLPTQMESVSSILKFAL